MESIFAAMPKYIYRPQYCNFKIGKFSVKKANIAMYRPPANYSHLVQLAVKNLCV
jgi:hypothetical protein